MKSDIRRVVVQHGRLTGAVDALGDDADLYLAGMTSYASVNVMLALESSLGVEFPDHMLRRSVFESISSIHAAVTELLASAARGGR